jgi:hypothetical protein
VLAPREAQQRQQVHDRDALRVQRPATDYGVSVADPPERIVLPVLRLGGNYVEMREQHDRSALTASAHNSPGGRPPEGGVARRRIDDLRLEPGRGEHPGEVLGQWLLVAGRIRGLDPDCAGEQPRGALLHGGRRVVAEQPRASGNRTRQRPRQEQETHSPSEKSCERSADTARSAPEKPSRLNT